MTRRVESPRNSIVQDAARLKERRHREATGTFLVEGAREVERALTSGTQAVRLLLAPPAPRELRDRLGALAAAAGADVVELSERAFARLSMRQGPDGVALVAVRPDRALDAGALPPGGLVLVLDGLEKPGNVGALLRTADAVAVSAVILAGAGADVENPNTVRSSQGSLFALRVFVAPLDVALSALMAAGYRVVAAAPGAGDDLWSVDLTGPVALLLGAEDVGLAPAALAAADALVRVPMRAVAADSLNVAVAGAVVLYEALRQRTAAGG